ncbi:MAG: universal stress protein [Bacteroidetes bacterium]|nr:universal stress protein [Bacteroidota bacterium]
MNILCPTDLTLAADVALAYAGHIAKQTSGSVTLFHALGKKDAKGDGADLAKAHADVLGNLSGLGVKVDKLQREGAFMKEIVTEAGKGCKLMVAGTHGVQGLRQEMLGSDMLKLVRTVPVPTLVVQLYSKRKVAMDRIVMPVAGHTDIKPLLDAVCLLAKAYGAEVDVYQQLVEGESTSNALLKNKVAMIDRLKKEGVRYNEVNEPVGKHFEGFATLTIRYAHKVGAGCIAVMAMASGEHKKIADKEKQELLTNEKGIPVLCAV